MEAEFVSFFTSFKGEKAEELSYPNSLVIKEVPYLDRDQQMILIQMVNTKEIDQDVKGMSLEKSRRVDKHPIEFFTRNWEEVKGVCSCATILFQG